MRPAMKKPCQRWKVDWACEVAPLYAPKLGSWQPVRRRAPRPTTTTARRRRGFLALRAGVSVVSEDGLVSDESTAPTLSNPAKKLEIAGHVDGQCGWVCGAAADSLAAQVKTPRAMVEVARAARA